MNQKHRTKSILLQGTSLILFFALAFGTTGTAAGLFDRSTDGVGVTTPAGNGLPFPGSPAGTTAPNESDPPSTQDPSNDPTAGYATNISKTFNPNLIEGYVSNRSSVSLSARVEVYNRLTAQFAKVERTVEPLPYQSYDPDIYAISRKTALNYEYITGTETIVKYTKELNNQDSAYITVANPYLIGRKTVQPYMGYLLISREEKGKTILSLHDINGNLLVDNLGTRVPYYARDFSNYPVFCDEDGNLFSFTGKKFINVDPDDLRINLFYDYPATPLGVYNGTYEVRYNPSENNYDYINYQNKKQYYSGNFFKAFNYSADGIAVVVEDTENSVRIINYRSRTVFKPGSQYIFYVDPNTGKRQHAKDYYYFPDTYGIESIGSQGFDHGYLRLRIRSLSMMKDSLGTVIRDQDYLVDTEGKKFPIPEGYTIEGYSDGVLLLSKDGLYGYYSIEGDWIAQPIYTYARPFIQGLAVVGSEDGTVGMIDTKGNIVLPFVFTSISDVSSGVIVTYCEGIGWEIFAITAK